MKLFVKMRLYTHKTVYLCLLLCWSFASLAEKPDSVKTCRIKFCLNSGYNKQLETRTEFTSYYTVENEFDITTGKPSFAFEIFRNTHISHEFDLLPFYFHTNSTEEIMYREDEEIQLISGATINSYESYAFYRFSYYFRDKSRRLRPFASLSAGLVFNRETFDPKISRSFPTQTTEFSIPLNIVPGVDFSLTEKIHFSLSIPVMVNDIVFVNTKIDNPQLAEKLRYYRHVYGVFLPLNFQIRLAMSYSINNNTAK